MLEDHLGNYLGEGRWRDDVGESHAYRVDFKLEARGGGLGIAFHHEFHEEPEVPDVHLDLTLAEIAPGLLTFQLGPVTGRGYWAEDLVAYAIPLPGNLVEASYFFGAGGCRVAGSSERNGAGHFIMWEERLRRRG